MKVLWLSLSRTADHWVQPAPPGGTSREQRAALLGRRPGLGQASHVLPTGLLLGMAREGGDALLEIRQNQARGAPDIFFFSGFLLPGTDQICHHFLLEGRTVEI